MESGAAREDDAELRKRLEQMQRLESIGTLAGGVAHEFNNLLMVMLSHADLALERSPADDRVREDVKQIQRAAWQATELTRQLLIFGRREVTDPQVVDVNAVASAVERLVSRGLEGHVTVTTVLAPDLGPVKIDPARLEQALLNLAVNARDAMPSGGVLRIETAAAVFAERHLQIPPGRYVRVSVTDTGVGMTKEVAERAFEPFYTTKQHGHGTGLGLAIVYGIVKQSGGYVYIDSEPGQGTALNVYLPVTSEPMRVAASAPRADPDHGPTTATILLVEDFPQVRELLELFLTRRGYTVLSAGSGAEALRLERQHRGSVDLLLTDVVLPDLSGPQLASRLRRWHGPLRTLYISGYAQDVVQTRGAIDGPLLQKPVTEAELLRAVRDVLVRGSAPPAHPSVPGQLRVVIVEDHWLVAEALARTLRENNMSVVAIGRTLAEVRGFASEARADVALVDYYLPDGTGADVARVLREARPDIAIVVLTGAPNEDALRRVVEAGAAGYLAKTEPPSAIVAAVRKAAEGEMLLDAEALRRLLASPRTPEAPRLPAGSELTRREQEVLALIAEGLTNAAMAERLGVSVTTIRSHVRGVIEKLGVNSKLQAVLRAREIRLL